MSDLKQIETLAKETAESNKQTRTELGVLTKQLNAVVDKLSKTPAAGQPTLDQIYGGIQARNGENPLSSRGFSFAKMIGLLTGAVEPKDAKVEIDFHNRLDNVYCKELGTSGYGYAGKGLAGVNKFMAPLAPSYMQESVVSRQFRQEMRDCVAAGCEGSMDIRDETSWMKRKALSRMGYSAKALSWLDELSGGALVAPPEMGELIELLRNKEALVNAGARTVPLPPQGRLKYPRQTSASTTYWVGENSPITQSQIGTGEVTLQAKKLAVLIQAPNELIRFASPAAEALLRDDMTKSLALGLDLAGLEGQGGDTRPRGVINFQNINQITSSSPNTNGDALVGQDIYRFISAVEESNAEFKGFIMRPKTLYRYYQLRFDAVAQGDSQGGFLFNLIREAGDDTPATLAGYPVTKSTQISQVRSKGNASNLTYIVGGMWDDLLIGMFGAIEFAATTMGDTSFTNDQTWVRGILSCDVAARHESAFVWCDNLIVVPNQS